MSIIFIKYFKKIYVTDSSDGMEVKGYVKSKRTNSEK